MSSVAGDPFRLIWKPTHTIKPFNFNLGGGGQAATVNNSLTFNGAESLLKRRTGLLTAWREREVERER